MVDGDGLKWRRSMKFVTAERLQELIKEARALGQDTSRYKKELSELKVKSKTSQPQQAGHGTVPRGHTMKDGKLRIYSMAKVEKSHFRGLGK